MVCFHLNGYEIYSRTYIRGVKYKYEGGGCLKGRRDIGCTFHGYVYREKIVIWERERVWVYLFKDL